MIEPNMATMIGLLTTDAQVPPALLRRALEESARDTFNAITVDGECSTNDTLFALASGASGLVINQDNYAALLEGLLTVSRQLAVDIVRGGEGRDQGDRRHRAGRATPRRCPPGGADDRQLAAGQDRGARRRSELGAASSLPRDGRA